MNLLLDTHALLWWLKDPGQLRSEAREAIRDPENLVYYSAANVWEIIIKSALGKLPPVDQSQMESALAEDQIRPLPITPAHTWAVAKLPPHHDDPFDRILVAQAHRESLQLVTRDPLLDPYPVQRLKA